MRTKDKATVLVGTGVLAAVAYFFARYRAGREIAPGVGPGPVPVPSLEPIPLPKRNGQKDEPPKIKPKRNSVETFLASLTDGQKTRIRAVLDWSQKFRLWRIQDMTKAEQAVEARAFLRSLREDQKTIIRGILTPEQIQMIETIEKGG